MKNMNIKSKKLLVLYLALCPMTMMHAAATDGFSSLHGVEHEITKQTIPAEILNQAYRETDKNETLLKAIKKTSPSTAKKLHESRYEIAALVLAGARIDTSSSSHYYMTALATGVLRSDFYLVKFLLEHRADPNIGIVPPEDFQTPLLNYCVDPAIAKLLLEHGANTITTGGAYGMSPLHCTMKKEIPALQTKLLVERGANVNRANRNGTTPLYDLAYSIGTCSILELLNAQKKIAILLRAGADTRIIPKFGKEISECLHLAAKNGPGLDLLLGTCKKEEIPIKINMLTCLANLIDDYSKPIKTEQQRIILPIIFDAYDCDSAVREKAEAVIKDIRTPGTALYHCKDLLSRYYAGNTLNEAVVHSA